MLVFASLNRFKDETAQRLGHRSVEGLVNRFLWHASSFVHILNFSKIFPHWDPPSLCDCATAPDWGSPPPVATKTT